MTEDKDVYYLFKAIKDGKEKRIEVKACTFEEAKVIPYVSGYHLTQLIAIKDSYEDIEKRKERKEVIMEVSD